MQPGLELLELQQLLFEPTRRLICRRGGATRCRVELRGPFHHADEPVDGFGFFARGESLDRRRRVDVERCKRLEARMPVGPQCTGHILNRRIQCGHPLRHYRLLPIDLHRDGCHGLIGDCVGAVPTRKGNHALFNQGGIGGLRRRENLGAGVEPTCRGEPRSDAFHSVSFIC